MSRFPGKHEVPDFAIFSSVLRISASYEMPDIRARLLEAIRDAHPENCEGLNNAVGKSVFGDEPHPNAVLNLFV
jgi:hypothetical protein